MQKYTLGQLYLFLWAARQNEDRESRVRVMEIAVGTRGKISRDFLASGSSHGGGWRELASMAGGVRRKARAEGE